MSGHDENVEAVSNRCDCGERQTMSHLMTCDGAHNCTMDRLGYINPCRCQLCQTLGGIYITAAIEDSTKKIILIIIALGLFAVVSLRYGCLLYSKGVFINNNRPHLLHDILVSVLIHDERDSQAQHTVHSMRLHHANSCPHC